MYKTISISSWLSIEKAYNKTRMIVYFNWFYTCILIKVDFDSQFLSAINILDSLAYLV